MDPLSLTITTVSFPLNPFPITLFSLSKTRVRAFSYGRKPKFLVSASKEEPKLNQWDLMELKFGRLLGEDPKLTLAKVMGKKLNPGATYLEIEKSFHKNKGKYDIEEIPIDWGKKGQSSDSTNGMNLVRPIPKKGFETNDKPLGSLNGLNLVRPVPKKGVKFETNDEPKRFELKKPKHPVGESLESVKRSVPNVILRKPSVYNEDDEDTPKFRIKPNLSLRMGNEQEKEKFSDMTLLRKPQQLNVSTDESKEEVESELIADVELKMQKEQTKERVSEILLSKRPEVVYVDTNLEEKQKSFDSTSSYEELLEPVNDSIIGLQSGFIENESDLNESSDMDLVNWSDKFPIEVALHGRPLRLDQSKKPPRAEEKTLGNVEREVNVGLDSFLTPPPLKKSDDMDWTRAEYLVKSGEREEVELISCSTRGFVVSFGSLIGFLPYRNLAAKWKFLAFESWLRRKGLDPSTYKQSLGIIGSYDDANRSVSQDSMDNLDAAGKSSGELSPEMKLEELLNIYEQEKIKFLSSFIGQRIKVNVLMADRKSRKLIFSIRPKEKEELVEKKKSLMAKLSVGDVVKCCIKKITYFGIFVEVEGVPALIHQTEVSWDSTLDPASYYKIGQIVEAKVHQLDFALERIFLSLKEITPDPLIEALESVVGDPNSLDGRLQAAEPDTEWAEVESLIKELQQIDGIQTVSKGRYFLSPGLAPTFQVYMASLFEDQYKLLARSGNKVQEVIVQTRLDKEEMKSTILTCTSRVE